MQDLPHHYRVSVSGGPEGPVPLASAGLPELETAPPAEFGGPGDRWSPETLLVGAVADCFVFTFRAIARASKLEWTDLRCEAEGTLDRAEGKTRFVAFALRAELSIPEGGDADRARRLLQKAESSCLVTNSLRADCELTAEVKAG